MGGGGGGGGGGGTEKYSVDRRGNLERNFILLHSAPLGNLFQQLYNTVDSIIVGNWIGSEALQQSDQWRDHQSSGWILYRCIAGCRVVVSQFFGAETS